MKKLTPEVKKFPMATVDRKNDMIIDFMLLGPDDSENLR